MCKGKGIQPIECFKMFGLIDKDQHKINNMIGKLYRLLNIVEAYRFENWEIGLNFLIDKKIEHRMYIERLGKVKEL